MRLDDRRARRLHSGVQGANRLGRLLHEAQVIPGRELERLVDRVERGQESGRVFEEDPLAVIADFLEPEVPHVEGAAGGHVGRDQVNVVHRHAGASSRSRHTTILLM